MKFEIVVKSGQELLELWHRLNLNPSGLKKGYDNPEIYSFNFDAPDSFFQNWREVNSVVEKHNLKP